MNRLKLIVKDNRGFSLVELLVGIVMLGIVVVPLLSTFITSARLSVEAEKMNEATTLAQNIAEEIESKDIHQIIEEERIHIDSSKDENYTNVSFLSNLDLTKILDSEAENVGGVNSFPEFDNETGQYKNDVMYAYVYDIEAGGTGNHYDALIEINSKSGAGEIPDTSAKYYEINNVDDFAFDNMDILFTQASGTSGSGYSNNPDETSRADFIQKYLSTLEYDESKIVLENRTITLTVEGGNTATVNSKEIFTDMTAELTYSYKYSYTVSAAEKYEHYYTESIVLTSSFPIIDGNPDDPNDTILDIRPNIYVMFYPHYDIKGGTGVDQIEIKNLDNIELDVFFYKMETSDIPSGETLGDLENDYEARIDLKESKLSAADILAGESQGSTKIYSNVHTNLATNTEIAGIIDSGKYRYIIGETFINTPLAFLDENDTQTVKKNRVYDITITILEHVDMKEEDTTINPTDNREVFTLESTKLQ